MASASTVQRNGNFDRSRTERFDASESTYACNCGQIYFDEARLKQHQQTDCKNRSFKCSFCQENFSSSGALRDHFVLCGNKTDSCPNCRQLIRRSHFTYHYENNCAPIDEVETPPSRPRNPLVQRLPVNFNKPIAREDIPNNDHPTNQYRRQPPPPVPSRATPKQEHSNGIVHVPCEFCDQPIDLPNWSKHTQSCREKEDKRLADRARLISKEPITEPLPCEHCHQSYAATHLSAHQENCLKNPRRGVVVGRNPRGSRFSRSSSLPRRLNHDRGHSPSPNARSRPPPRNAHYDVLDVDRTHEANRSRLRRSASDDQVLLLSNAPDRASMYDNQALRPNERPYRPVDVPQRVKSPSNNLERKENRDPKNNAYGERSAYYNDHEGIHRDHRASNRYLVINNQQDSPTIKTKKASLFKRLFGCASTQKYAVN